MSEAPDTDASAPLRRSAAPLLIGAIFGLAVCGLVYELIAGALSSYLLGDSVTQFSIVIGLFLTAMGVGSFCSRFFRKHLLASLIAIETAIGLIGGIAGLVGFAAFAYTDFYTPVLLSLIAVVGVLIGLEIPLVIRILRDLAALRLTLANVLAADYLGALAASLIFPFVLLPQLGIVRAGLLMGLLNVAVAVLLIVWFRPVLRERLTRLLVATIGSAVILIVAFALCGKLVHWFENRIYQDEVILARDTQYQRLVLTRWQDDIRLYLDGHLQFSSIDEYRYHELLVHPTMNLAQPAEQVLILGGGDGLAAREVLKHPRVKHIDLVDLDSVVTDLFANRPLLTALNNGSLSDPRVQVHNVDAFKFLEQGSSLYNVILIDLPDPSRAETGKLYSRAFYGLVARRLARRGVAVTQATSPFRSREAFWCIAHTLAATPCGPAAGDTFHTTPLNTYIPSFGTWGFVLATRQPPAWTGLTIDVPTRFLTPEVLNTTLTFPPDLAEIPTPITTLDDPVVTHLYIRGYHRYLD